MTLEQLLSKKELMYRSQLNTAESKAVPTFIGPGGVLLQEPEVSFGLLYATSLRRSLANDLRQQAISMGCSVTSRSSGGGDGNNMIASSTWQGSSFLQFYNGANIIKEQTDLTQTTLLGENCSLVSSASPQQATVQQNQSGIVTIQFNSQQQAMALDAALWNMPDWTWSFFQSASSTATTTPPMTNVSNATNKSIINIDNNNNNNNNNNKARGSVNRDMWMHDRFAACNASYTTLVSENTGGGGGGGGGGMAVRPITLCEPAPTAGLQSLCQAMLQYRTNIQAINCEIMGKGSCLYRPGTFYVPYVWSPTNQEFAADTVIGYYQSILKQPRFSDETYTRLCSSRNSLLDRLTLLSQSQNQQCPAYQIEYLKGIMQSLKNIGHELLYMGYCLVMFVVNILSIAFSQNAFAMNSILQIAQFYLVEFVTTAQDIIMPLLNAMINILFGVSSVGKVLKDALYYICEYYNYIIKNIYIPIWCAVVRPALYVIFNTLEGIVVPFSRDAANQIDSIWVAIAGGDGGISISDTTQCLGSIKININCGGDTIKKKDNASAQIFNTAALATLCWTDSSVSSSMAGAGILGGVSSASYLSCTASDTCALDPLNFDSYDTSKQNLVPCTSCPSLMTQAQTQMGIQRFGCDTYLKRCTCGVVSNSPTQCMSNSDCSSSQQQQTPAICAVTSNLDLVSQASTHLPCSECGSMAMQPVCVVSGGNNIMPVCACTAVAQTGMLQSCNNRGQKVSLLQATGQCLATSNYDLQSNTLSINLVLDFGTLTMLPCALGMSSDNGCVGVNLPLASGGQYVRSLVVLFSSIPISSSPGNKRSSTNRRLLIHQSGNPLTASAHLHLDEVQLTAILKNWSHTSRFCQEAFLLQDRERVKWCLHWRFAAISVQNMLGYLSNNNNDDNNNNNILSSPPPPPPTQKQKNSDDAILLSWSSLLNNPKTLFAIATNKDTLQFILRQNRNALFPALIDTSIAIIADSVSILMPLLHNNISNYSRQKEENKYENSTCDNCSSIQTTTTAAAAAAATATQQQQQQRKLLQAYPLSKKTLTPLVYQNGRRSMLTASIVPTISCKALEKPLQAIASAFWDTVNYYYYHQDANGINKANDTEEKNSSSNNNIFNANATNNSNRDMRAFSFTLPPLEDSKIKKGVAGDFADFVSGGYGRFIIAAFTSNEQYNESSNLLTGRRLLKELSYCNYTKLTTKTGGDKSVPLLYIGIIVGILFLLLTTLCASSSACLSWILWIILFPMVFFWVAYGTSPLCWPMIPPSLPHDIAVEITSIVPESLEIPRFLVEDHCTIRGILSDGTYDPRCFKQCQQAPFLMQSWQVPRVFLISCFFLNMMMIKE